jgi:hypothetical protein
MKFIIFTDEAGSWNQKPSNEESYYVRCWVRISYKDRKYLSGDVEIIKNSSAKVYLTFSKLSEFYSQKYNIREEIEREVGTVFLRMGESLKDYMHKIPKEIRDAINRVLFLYIYERYAWEYAKTSGILNNVDQIFIHSPQFTKADYKDLLKTLGFGRENYVFIEGNKNRGISAADTLSRLMKKVLTEDFKNKERVLNLKKIIQNSGVEKGNMILGVDKVFCNRRWAKNLYIKDQFQKYLQ